MARYRVEMTFEIEGTDQDVREGVLKALSNPRVTWADGTDPADVAAMAIARPEGALFLTLGTLELDKQLSGVLSPLAVRSTNGGLRVEPLGG